MFIILMDPQWCKERSITGFRSWIRWNPYHPHHQKTLRWLFLMLLWGDRSFAEKQTWQLWSLTVLGCCSTVRGGELGWERTRKWLLAWLLRLLLGSSGSQIRWVISCLKCPTVHSLYSSKFVQGIDVQIKAPSLPDSLAAMIDQVIQFSQ